MRRREEWGWGLVVLVCVIAGIGAPQLSATRAAARYPVTAADLADGQAALDVLSVRSAEAVEPRSYTREAFGAAWADVDLNGCDTRNDVLRRDLAAVTVDPATDGCVALRGTLHDPYTGGTVAFVRGERSSDVQVDHVVALADAWRSGARSWTPSRREHFANDPANLLAVDGGANQDKGAANAAEWLPPESGYGCVYALRQVRVKSAYGLTVAADERDALADQLDRCVVAR